MLKDFDSFCIIDVVRMPFVVEFLMKHVFPVGGWG